MTYETERLNALRALDLLDTPPSESFDRITRMAAQIFGLPIAAVSLTDTDRQWFKSRVGIDHWEIPREIAPCGEVAESCGTLVIRDILSDDVYKHSNLAKSGIRFYAGAPLMTRDGYGLGAMCVLGTEPREVTEQEISSLNDLAAMVMAQIELQHAFGRVDPSTGLANQNQMIDDLEDAARDHPGAERVIVFVDLLPVQHLSEALRVLGTNFVDDLASCAVRLLREALPDTKLYRIDNTHFGFVLESHDADDLHRIVERLCQKLGDAQQSTGIPLILRPAIGLAPFKLASVTARDIVRSARSAAQDARNLDVPVALHSHAEDGAHKRRFTLLTDMPRALKAADQLHMVYQPRVDIASGACVGAEALIRWTHPELGPISPAEFIPIIEQTGLARDLTDWVIRNTLQQIALWQTEGRNLVVSINISAVNLDEADFTDRLLHQLDHFGVKPGSLELELTESALISNGQRALNALNGLKAKGLRIAVDDFGTGYSSLGYLRCIPAHCVKIDRSFVQELGAHSRDLQLVTAMITMLHGMDFRVVAEGVETSEAFHLLGMAGCDEAQGYLLAKPLVPSALESWLDTFDGVPNGGKSAETSARVAAAA